MTEKPNEQIESEERFYRIGLKTGRKQALAEVREKINENLVARITKLNHKIFHLKDIDGMYGCCVCEKCCLNRAKAIELASFKKDFKDAIDKLEDFNRAFEAMK